MVKFIKAFTNEKEAEIFAAMKRSKVVKKYDYDSIKGIIISYVVRY